MALTGRRMKEETKLMGRLAGETAIVTGAAQGIGKGIARAMAAEGARVMIFDIADTAEAAAADIRNGTDTTAEEVRAFKVDVTDASQITRALDSVLKDFGKVDILVNNVAVLYFASFMDMSDEMRDKTIDVNFKGTWNCAKAVVPGMMKQKYGRIINMSSAAAITSSKGLTAYSASKGAICAFSRALALDVAEFGMNVNTIIPCYVETEGLRDVAVNMGVTPEAYLERIGSTVPLGRLASVDEIGDLAVFLASRESKYITGQEIIVDGGNLIQTKKGEF
jgi:NAD(P)-dependent dehydrogenase (short-subunit alcohol dehydrogenase family)